jgi:hypothetical protein
VTRESRREGLATQKVARIDRLLISGITVQFDKVDQHQPVRGRPLFLASANRAILSGNAIRVRSMAFPSHNGTPYDLASARTPPQPLLLA